MSELNLLSNERLLELYRQMVLIRQFELRAIDERRQGVNSWFYSSLYR